MPEFFTAIGSAIIQKIVNFKGFPIFLIGILLLINLVTLFFPITIFAEIKTIDYFAYVIDLIYLLLYSSISLLILFSFSIYLSLIIYCASELIIEKFNKYKSKFLNKIDLYSFSTIKQSANFYESALEWVIISFLLLLLFDNSNILSKASKLYNFLTKNNNLSILPIYLMILPAIPSLYVIVYSLYKRFFIEKDFYFDEENYD